MTGDLSYTDYALALKAAQHGQRLLVVHFGSRNRPICKAMEDETLSSPEVVRLTQAHFIDVKLDSELETDLFERLIGERGALATCVVDPSEDVIAILPGFAPVSRFVDFLQVTQKGYARLVLLRNEARRHATDALSVLRLGDAYESLGSSRRAGETYRTVIALKQGGGEARERLARILIDRGRSVEARSEVEEARKLDPEGRSRNADRFLLTEALLLSLERNLREAVARLTDLLQRFPGSTERPQALFALGTIQHELRDDTSALTTLEQVLREHPGSRWAEPARGQIAHIRSPEPDHRH